MKYLDAVVAPIGDGDLAGGAKGDAGRPGEMRGARAIGAEHIARRAVGMDEPAAAVADADHGGPIRPELVRERAVGVEHLDAVVARVGDKNTIAPGASPVNALRRQELPGAGAVGAELAHQPIPKQVQIDRLDSVVARVGDECCTDVIINILRSLVLKVARAVRARDDAVTSYASVVASLLNTDRNIVDAVVARVGDVRTSGTRF